MKKVTTLLILTFTFSCSEKAKEEHPIVYETENLVLKQLSEHCWMHISYLATKSFGKVPCNGLIYASDNQAFIFDTPTTNIASDELIHFLDQREIEIKGVVATHFHEDCLGGLESFHQVEIPSYASALTIELAQKANVEVLPKNTIANKENFQIDSKTIEIRYFGHGHTYDNMVAYIPSEEMLFGGCLVKSLNSGKGYLGDADTLNWSKTVTKVKDTYPNLKNVVPGHGQEGGPELLDYTAKLFQY